MRREDLTLCADMRRALPWLQLEQCFLHDDRDAEIVALRSARYNEVTHG